MLKQLFILFICIPFLLSAVELPLKPSNYITDEANVLSEEQEQLLNTKLKLFEDSTSTQIFVFVSASLNGRVMAEVCQELFRTWGIGQKNKDNGVLVAVFVDDHKFRIHTGSGMEGALPDILTKRIQDKQMGPHFKSNNYFEGINEGLDQLIYYSVHEFKQDELVDTNWENVMYGFAFNALMLVLFLYRLHRKKQDLDRKPATKIILTILAIILSVIPCIGSIILGFLFLIFMKTKGGSGGGGYYSSSSDTSWSSSDSSSDSSSSFDGGGGGDSGGGGSDSSW
jgi:uncharacterized protein